VLPTRLQKLFVRAFVDGHRAPDARPAAGEWVTALADEGKRLKTCGANPNHLFAQSSRSCPWCRLTSDPFPGPIVAGRQIAVAAPPGQIPEAARVEQVRAYARVALADGAITEHEFAYLRKAGGELGLKTAVIDRVIDDETRRSGVSYAQPRASQPSPTPSAPVVNGNGHAPASAWVAVRSSVAHPTQALQAVRDRRLRSAAKAAAPVVLVCMVAAALAPVVAPVGAAVLGVPLLAAVGEARSAKRWRAYAKVPWRVAVYVHHALGHAARVFVPIAAAGAVATILADVPALRADIAARTLSVLAVAALCWVVIARVPSGGDALAQPVRSGRDLLRGALVGPSGRTRRPGYVLWAIGLAGVAAIVAGVLTGTPDMLWWPLPRLP
jgi:hypothetical protein